MTRCRVDPYVYRVIKHYTRLNKLSYEFVYGWRHFVEIGLAPVEYVYRGVRVCTLMIAYQYRRDIYQTTLSNKQYL